MWENLKKILFPVMLAAILILAGTTYFFINRYQEIKKDPQKVVRDQTQAVVNKVAKLIVLPTGEEPTIATVTDPSILKDQAFFAHAQTGDVVLIYTNAKKAILYSPRENKIVEVAPLNIGPAAQAPAAQQTPATSTPEE